MLFRSPDRATDRAVGELLPTIDLKDFGDDKSALEEWLVQQVGVRKQLTQIRLSEWREILTTQIPALIQQLETNNRKVQRWYEAALESASSQESGALLASAPLLCRRGQEWAYVSGEQDGWLTTMNLQKLFVKKRGKSVSKGSFTPMQKEFLA